MQSPAAEQTGRRRRKNRKKKIAHTRKLRTHEVKRRNAAGALMAGFVFVIMLSLLLYLLLPFLTREKVLTVDVGGRLSVQDQPQRFQRAIE